MNVFLNAPDEQITLLNNIGEFLFTNNINKDINAVVLISGQDEIIDDVIEKNVPTIVLVDAYHNKEGRVSKSFLNRGFLAKSLIYMDGERLKNHIGEEFNTLVPRGVGLAALKELIEYAAENNLYPELIIWKPIEPTITFPTTQQADVVEQPIENTVTSEKLQPKQEVFDKSFKEESKRIENFKKEMKQEPPKEVKRESKKQVRNETFNVTLDKYIKSHEKVILLMKPTIQYEPQLIIKELREKERFNLLDATDNQSLFSLYGRSIDEAISTGYYSIIRNNQVNTGSIKVSTLIILLDSFGNNSSMIDDSYDIVNQKYFVLSNHECVNTSEDDDRLPKEKDIGVVIDWENNGLSADGVLVENEMLAYYKQELKLPIFTVENFTL